MLPKFQGKAVHTVTIMQQSRRTTFYLMLGEILNGVERMILRRRCCPRCSADQSEQSVMWIICSWDLAMALMQLGLFGSIGLSGKADSPLRLPAA